jgi:hypothetical protein
VQFHSENICFEFFFPVQFIVQKVGRLLDEQNRGPEECSLFIITANANAGS